MQVVIPVAYNVCEVKLDQINHWLCVHREDFQLRCILKYKLNVGLVIGCATVSNWDPKLHFMS